jgi:hypothetical protein
MTMNAVQKRRHLELVREHFNSAQRIASSFGFSKEQTLACTTLGPTLLTATEVGRRCSPPISVHQVNRWLVQEGLQSWGENGNWELTKAGEKSGVYIPDVRRYDKNSSPVIQIRWMESVVSRLKEAS